MRSLENFHAIWRTFARSRELSRDLTREHFDRRINVLAERPARSSAPGGRTRIAAFTPTDTDTL